MNKKLLAEMKEAVSALVKQELAHNAAAQPLLTPEQLAERWGVTLKCLETWRFQGKKPEFIKMQDSPKGLIRYPLHGARGVLATEKSWLRQSTSDTGESHAE